ncbi:putative cyclin-B3-1 isoform X2 [Jatropha curcas]|uniref:putative cyclin-B3-1 isoform X2 n=1 Tax=Jatropha curcas TaxID=180498 RepID=UPI0018960230|nr:putative cyclin-B3-1 isoform X2 [Jatropha curcas]
MRSAAKYKTDQQGSKMVAATVKRKAQMGTNRVSEVGRNFKVYSDNEKVKLDATSMLLGPLNKGAHVATASDSKLFLRTRSYSYLNFNVKGLSKFAEKSKDKSVRSSNQDLNVRRKALADVTNAQSSSFSSNVMFDGSKPMIPVGSESRAVKFSSRKCTISMGRKNTSQRFSDIRATRKGVKNLSGPSDHKMTNMKNPGHAAAVDNQRSSRNSLVSTRSMLVAANRGDTSNIKNNDEGSEKSKRNSGLSGKVKVSKDVVPQVSIRRSYLRRNRVSDGFLTRTGAPSDQTDVKTNGWSRKFIKPTLKTAISVSNAHRTSKSKCTSAVNKSISIAGVSSRKKEKSVTSSQSSQIPTIVSHEATQEPPSDSNNKSTTNKSDCVVWRKSDRRKSYTFSLMAGSKLLAEQSEVIKEERLPCIDDSCNQLEVAEYVDEIYQFYWVSETQDFSLANYKSIQTEITPQMRGVLVNWLIEVHLKFELMQETLYLLVKVLDQYLSQVQIKKNDMQLVGLTALLLASKYEDYWHPMIKDLLSISAESYTRKQMLVMEKHILKKLKFRLNTPTPYVFMLRFLKAAQSDVELKHLAFYLIELCLVEYEALKFKPSMLCAAAIYVARSTLQKAPAWTSLLAKHARYEVSQIRDCAEMILRFHKAASISHLKVTYGKYMKPEFSSVAALQPLDKLPF